MTATSPLAGEHEATASPRAVIKRSPFPSAGAIAFVEVTTVGSRRSNLAVRHNDGNEGAMTLLARYHHTHHDTLLIGEMPVAMERVIVAPTAGIFEPLPMSDHVLAGMVVGTISQRDQRTEVVCQWQGRFMGHLADTGDRVRDAQALAWVYPTP